MRRNHSIAPDGSGSSRERFCCREGGVSRRLISKSASLASAVRSDLAIISHYKAPRNRAVGTRNSLLPGTRGSTEHKCCYRQPGERANQPRDLSRRVGRISFHWMAQFQTGRLSASCASRLRFEDHIQETVAVTQTQTRMRKETVNTTMNSCENCLPQESIFRIATNSAGLRSPPPRQLLQNRRTDFLPFP